jgi:hypothetical protein
LLSEALTAARAIGDEGSRSRALAALAPHLPVELLSEALAVARAIGDEGSRSRALAALAAQLPEQQRAAVLAEALTAARAIGDEGYRSDALAALAAPLAHLSSADLCAVWTTTLPLLATRTRRDLLADLRNLVPVLAALAGSNAPTELREIARAITDVARWWP